MDALIAQLNDAHRNYFNAARNLDELENEGVDGEEYDEAFNRVEKTEVDALDAAIALASGLGKPTAPLEGVKESPGKRMLYFMDVRERLSGRWGN